MNLFASFILRALAVLVKDIVFYNSYSKRPNSESGWMSYLSEVIPSHLMGRAGEWVDVISVRSNPLPPDGAELVSGWMGRGLARETEIKGS